MIDSTELTTTESFWLFCLILLFLFDLIRLFSSRDPLAPFQPPAFVIGFLSYYCLVGPIQRLINNDWVNRLRDFRYAAAHGWAGAVIFYLSFRLGYGIFVGWFRSQRFTSNSQSVRIGSIGNRLCWIGLILFSLVYGLRTIALINPFDTAESMFFATTGFNFFGFDNYLAAGINLLIPGVLLIFANWIRQRGNPSTWIFWTLLSIAIFTSLGFRFRVITLVVPMVMLWFLAQGRRPQLLTIATTAILLLAFAGFVGVTRSYGSGLNADNAAGLGFFDFLTEGLGEASIFLTTGAILANTPSIVPFVGFAPIINTLLFPIPAVLLENKDSADYLFNSLATLYGSDTLGIGDAVLNFGEYFMMFGWPSLIVMGLIFGGLFRSLWNWFSIRRDETLAQVAYVTTMGLSYIWVSRGYMPQVALTFAFGAFPLFYLYYRYAQPRLPKFLDPALTAHHQESRGVT